MARKRLQEPLREEGGVGFANREVGISKEGLGGVEVLREAGLCLQARAAAALAEPAEHRLHQSAVALVTNQVAQSLDADQPLV
jgi:hypothetical protein